MKNTYTETEVKTLFKTFIKDVVDGGDFEFGLAATMQSFKNWWNRDKDRALAQEVFTKDELREAFGGRNNAYVPFSTEMFNEDFEKWFNKKYKTK